MGAQNLLFKNDNGVFKNIKIKRWPRLKLLHKEYIILSH
jgi:hypothetical protein